MAEPSGQVGAAGLGQTIFPAIFTALAPFIPRHLIPEIVQSVYGFRLKFSFMSGGKPRDAFTLAKPLNPPDVRFVSS